MPSTRKDAKKVHEHIWKQYFGDLGQVITPAEMKDTVEIGFEPLSQIFSAPEKGGKEVKGKKEVHLKQRLMKYIKASLARHGVKPSYWQDHICCYY
jgi:hypothetical protein